MARPAKVARLIDQIKKQTGARAVGLVGDPKRLVRTAAVCAGTCGRILNTVIAQKADLYLTGELKHHEALAAQEAGLTCICLSHTVSERFMLCLLYTSDAADDLLCVDLGGRRLITKKKKKKKQSTSTGHQTHGTNASLVTQIFLFLLSLSTSMQ